MSDNDLPPPPPYSEQEFDQKVSEALTLSAQQPQVTASEEEWEQWSEAAFLAAEERNRASNVSWSNQGEGSSTQTQPLQRQEHHHVASPQASATIEPWRTHQQGTLGGKQRPSWMEDLEPVSRGDPRSAIASTDTSSSTTAHSWHPIPSFPDPNHIITSSVVQPWHIQQTDILLDNDHEDFSLPPPSFATIGPPTDGLARLEYHPESTPPSPLASPVLDHHPPFRSDVSQPSLSLSHAAHPSGQYLDGYHGHTQRALRHSLPMPPRPNDYFHEQRPTSVQNLRQIPSLSHKEPMAPMLPPPSIQNISRVDHGGTIPSTHGKIVGRSAPRTAYSAANTESLYKPAVSAQLANSTSTRSQESASPYRSHLLEAPHLQPVRHQNRTLVGTDANTRVNMSTQTGQGLHLHQQSNNVSYFPQHPSHHTSMTSTPHRWAISEQQINQSFQ